MRKNQLGFPLLCFVAGSLAFSGCASLSRRNQDEKNQELSATAQSPVEVAEMRGTSGKPADLTALEISRLHTRIEELEAKLAGLTDSMSSLRTSVDNVLGPKDLRTVGVGSNADGVGVTQTDAKSSQAIKTLAQKPVTSDDSPFTSAMNLFRSSQFSEAVLAFSEFANRNPSSLLAPSAFYYSGESYFMLKQYKLAIPEYQKVLRQYPNSARIAPSLVRISHALTALGSKEEAKQYFDVAAKAYPGHPCLDWPAPTIVSSMRATDGPTRMPASTVMSSSPTSGNVASSAPGEGNSPDALDVSPMEPSLSPAMNPEHVSAHKE